MELPSDLDKVPCHKSKNKAFLSPFDAPDYSVRAAVKMCQSCPVRKLCAYDALHSGDLMDGSLEAPANGVIMAGVVCEGMKSVEALAVIAETGVPASYRTQGKREMVRKGQPCKSCNRPLYPWTRDRSRVPEGYVMARGRGFCTDCRKAYNDFLASLPEDERGYKGLRKITDRNNKGVAERLKQRQLELERMKEELIQAFAQERGIPVERVVPVREVARVLNVSTDSLRRRARNHDALLVLPEGRVRIFVDVTKMVEVPVSAA